MTGQGCGYGVGRQPSLAVFLHGVWTQQLVSSPTLVLHQTEMTVFCLFHFTEINARLSFQIPIVSGLCNLMFSTDSLLYLPGNWVYVVTVTDRSDWFEWADYEIRSRLMYCLCLKEEKAPWCQPSVNSQLQRERKISLFSQIGRTFHKLVKTTGVLLLCQLSAFLYFLCMFLTLAVKYVLSVIVEF